MIKCDKCGQEEGEERTMPKNSKCKNTRGSSITFAELADGWKGWICTACFDHKPIEPFINTRIPRYTKRKNGVARSKANC